MWIGFAALGYVALSSMMMMFLIGATRIGRAYRVEYAGLTTT
jgi:hypothetical protein